MSREQQRRKTKTAKKRPPLPEVDTLTVAWMTTLATSSACLFGALLARGYASLIDRSAKMIDLLSAYLLTVAAVIGIVLLILTPIVVRRRRSNPPGYIVAAAFIAGALPWLLILMRMVR
ncbi:MAG: hypothetical protein JNL96_09845 [Planctomycetaceae bacterium]|nr:hypothetical protein [Planctomycetaceae bacterium]